MHMRLATGWPVPSIMREESVQPHFLRNPVNVSEGCNETNDGTFNNETTQRASGNGNVLSELSISGDANQSNLKR